MIKRWGIIAGYLCPKTRKHAFFICIICSVACLLNVFAPTVARHTSGTAKVTARVPILMYHSILDNRNRVGKYVITPAMLEDDLKYLKENGYQTVTTTDLLAFSKDAKPLPEKPIVITFDDGYYNNYSYAYPLLKKYNMHAVLSVVGEYADRYSDSDEGMNNNYSHAKWSMLKEMQDAKIMEIENHSYSLHNWAVRRGILRKKGEDAEHYKQLLLHDLTMMQDKMAQNLGKPAKAFAYPFGTVNRESREIVENDMQFLVTYGCEEGINILTTGSPLYNLKRYNRSGNVSREELFKKIEKEL